MLTKPKPLKPKKCRTCKKEFSPFSSTQVVCSITCAIEQANKKRIAQEATFKRQERIKTKKRKDDAKSLTEWLDDAQKAFNEFIRLRDGKVCISCGTMNPNIQYCAGHYRTRGAAGHLRFNEDNVHSQCNHYCNLKRSGNIINYRIELLEKIGIDRVTALECNNEVKRWTIEEAKAIKAHYTQRCKELIKLQGE